MNHPNILKPYTNIPCQTKEGKEYYKKIYEENPTEKDIFFHTLKINQLKIARDMLKMGFFIDQIDKDGETLLHKAFHYRKNKFIYLALAFDANLNKTNRFNENSFFISTHYKVSLNVFKKIWSQANNIEDLFSLDNNINENLLDQLFIDLNLNKIKWLDTHHPEFSQVKDRLTQLAQNKGHHLLYYYLSGKEDLNKKLNKQLSYNLDSKIVQKI